MFTEDLSVFFETSDFAETATFSGGTVNGILDQEYVETFNSSGFKPIFTCKTSDVSSYGQSDQFTVNGTGYMIESKEQDGTGISRLVLREV